MMADAVLKGRNRVMSVSTCPQGEYSCSRVSIGVPVVLGRNGIEKIIELKLSDESQTRFEKSVVKIEETIASLISPNGFGAQGLLQSNPSCVRSLVQ